MLWPQVTAANSRVKQRPIDAGVRPRARVGRQNFQSAYVGPEGTGAAGRSDRRRDVPRGWWVSLYDRTVPRHK